jgi:hypothetical protein
MSTAPSSRPTTAHWTGDPLADPQSGWRQEEYEVGKITLDRLLIATEPFSESVGTRPQSAPSAPAWLDVAAVARGRRSTEGAPEKARRECALVSDCAFGKRGPSLACDPPKLALKNRGKSRVT